MALLFPIFALAALAGLTPLKFDGENLLPLCVATPFIFGYLKLRNPVKVLGVKKNVARVRILNAAYAASFESLNPPAGV
jgi:hypothetical protein